MVLAAELEARVLSTAKVLLASKQCTADAEIGSAEQPASTSAEQPTKKLKSAHAIGTSSAAQPAPTSTADDGQCSLKQSQIWSYAKVVPPDAEPTMSATEPPREAQHGWSQSTHSVRELTRELRAVVRHERLCDDVREMLLSNLAMLNKLRQLPCTRAMLRTTDLKKVYQRYATSEKIVW